MSHQPSKKHSEFAKHLVLLYGDYCDALVEAEQNGQGKYTDQDFNDLGNFIRFLRNNYL